MESKNKITVSIVIVCMNNLKNIYPCLDSIKKYTTVSYETLVVAYLFSEDNLQKLKQDYPWITIIESTEIRGFSENNNLALRQAKGEYCFVLNDDTEMRMDVLRGLVETIKCLPQNVAIISPNILNFDETIQFSGRRYAGKMTFLLYQTGLLRFLDNLLPSKYVNQTGIFKTYNILGAAFLIKTSIFKQVGWFDEYYFFSPEDIALSTTLNKKGFKCYVNSDLSIIHYGGNTGKSDNLISIATRPAMVKGSLHCYSNGNCFYYFILQLVCIIFSVLRVIYFGLRKIVKPESIQSHLIYLSYINVLSSLFTRMTPKETFIYFYNKISQP